MLCVMMWPASWSRGRMKPLELLREMCVCRNTHFHPSFGNYHQTALDKNASKAKKINTILNT